MYSELFILFLLLRLKAQIMVMSYAGVRKECFLCPLIALL